jgi:hypothetical protein
MKEMRELLYTTENANDRVTAANKMSDVYGQNVLHKSTSSELRDIYGRLGDCLLFEELMDHV